MPLDDDELRWLILDLLKNPGERDKQRLIGPSEIGNPCAYCVANRLINTPKGESQYWLGAKIGTAIHAELEREEEKHIVTPQSGRFRTLKGARIEQSITLGTIEGYGTVKAKPDLVLVNDRHLVDHKTSSKKKVQKYKLDGVPRQYVIQQNLYAWGLNQNDIPIEKISLSFINREGTQDSDVWIYSFPYDEQVALDAWDRLDSIWRWLQEGHDVEDIASDPECYYCTRVLYRA